MALTTVDQGLLGTYAQYTGFKNRLINGAMMIDQRNAGASVTPSGAAPYSLDRWKSALSVASKFTVQQNAGAVTPPTGYKNYLGVTSSSAYTVGAAELFSIYQPIEGFNVADLGWGTINAATITLSFWVRSSLTGTFGGAVNNSAQNRSYPFSYSISSANTWEQKTITIAGDTTGTWLTDNGVGLNLFFSLGTGSSYSGTAGSWAAAGYYSATGATSVVGTNGATFYITGVQLEKGSTATSFDYRPYGQELALCQRYCEVYTKSNGSENLIATGFWNDSLNAIVHYYFKVQKRINPTVTFNNVSYFECLKAGIAWYACTAITYTPNYWDMRIQGTVGTAQTTAAGTEMRIANANGMIIVDAEL